MRACRHQIGTKLGLRCWPGLHCRKATGKVARAVLSLCICAVVCCAIDLLYGIGRTLVDEVHTQTAQETTWDGLKFSPAGGGGIKYVWSKGYGLTADVSAGEYTVFNRPIKLGERGASVLHGRITADRIKDGDLVWIGIYHLPQFIYRILPYTSAKFAIITGDGDDAVPSFAKPIPQSTRELHRDLLTDVSERILASKNIVRWFAQNACPHYVPALRRCLPDRRWKEKLVAYPIGLDLHTLALSGQKQWDSRGKRTVQEQTEELDEIVSRLAPVERRMHAVYAAFTNGTNPYIRNRWLRHFSTVSFAVLQKKSMERRLLWKRFGQFAFVASPPGNGFDCHRTWEALILGCIVIVQNSSVALNTLYEGLAVVVVNDVQRDVTAKNMETWVKKLGPRTRHAAGRKKLTLAYWHSRMRAEVQGALATGHF